MQEVKEHLHFLPEAMGKEGSARTFLIVNLPPVLFLIC